MWYVNPKSRFNAEESLLRQLTKHGFEFDQKLQRALQVSASKPDLYPEDVGFPDSYLTLALYRLNSILTRVVELDESRYNLFHNYKLAPPCRPEDVIPGRRLCRVLDRAADLAELKSEDVQYLMTFESNRIVFRPTSVLDTYLMRNPLGVESTELALLTHFRDQYAGVRPSEILELEELINDPRAKEGDLQRFFENHPHFFRMWDYRDVYPHVYLTREDEGPLIPDFILVDPELQKAMVLDLKLPKAKLVVRKPNRRRFASAVDEAKAQLLEYRDWFEDRHNRAKLKEILGMEIFRPRMGVVIGTSQEFRTVVERQQIASRYPEIEVVTYDDIVRHAQRRLFLVKGATGNR